jgi:AcrR family transcriptional regulator
MARPSDPLARAKLLAAAEAEFVEHGLDGAKVSDITARAGMSKGSFYLHFESKTQIFRELVEAFVARLAVLTESGLEQCGCAQPDNVRALLDQWVSLDVEIFELLWQNRGLIRLLLEGGPGAQFRYLVDDLMERTAHKARQFLAVGVKSGFYRQDLDLDLTAAFIAGAYDRVARTMMRETSRPELRPTLERIQHLVLLGIASPELRTVLQAPAVESTELRLAFSSNQ